MSILSKLQALLTAANTKTGQSDTTLTAAVQTLVDGFGQGGGSAVTGTFSVENDTTATVKITDLETIGFTPSIFLMYSTVNHTTESIQYAVAISCRISIGDYAFRILGRFTNTEGTLGINGVTDDWSHNVNGYLSLTSGGDINLRANATNIVPGGETYNWIALP